MLTRSDGVGCSAREVALIRQAGEEVRQLGGGGIVREPHRALVVRGRLAVSAEARGPLGSGDAELERRRSVVGLVGVVREPSEVGRARVVAQDGSGSSGGARAAAAARQVCDREPAELVSEDDRRTVDGENADRDALVHTGDVRPTTRSSRESSTRWPITAAASSASRAGRPTCATRASTASRAVAGMPAPARRESR